MSPETPAHHSNATTLHNHTFSKMMTPNDDTWTAARKEFREAVTAALEDLLKTGFSRERATAIVLRQMEGEQEKPSDEEVSVVVHCIAVPCRNRCPLRGLAWFC